MTERGLLRATIGELLDRNAELYPNQDAAVFWEQNLRYTWFELKKAVDEAAKGFLKLGIKKGDHIAIWATNVREWLITQFAAAKIGAVLVTINPEFKSTGQLGYALKQSDSQTLVLMESFRKISSSGKVYDYDYPGLFKKLCPEIASSEPGKLNAKEVPELKNVILISEDPQSGMFRWQDILKMAEAYSYEEGEHLLKDRQNSVKPEDTVVIQYTSGTTGYPKGVMLSHFNVVNNAFHGAANMLLTCKDKICGPVPFYHCFGSILLNLCCLVAGATIVIPSQHFDAKKTLEAIEKEKCTGLHGVPTMFIAELAEPGFEKFDLSSLRTGIMAGAPCPIELMKDVVNKMGAKQITIVYGLTEASPITHQTRSDDLIERRVSTVGKPIEGVEAKIVDPKTFKELPIDEVGEIWVRGYNVMSGYYKKQEETAKTIVEGGWLRTGDLGKKDSEGYYKITGRLKDMLIVGGHNVYPAEVEKALREMFEGFFEEIQVIGIPHDKFGEVGAVWIKLKPGKILTAGEITKRCNNELEWPQVPRYFKFIEEIPLEAMTATGKIQKFKLRELLIKELGLEELARQKTA